MSHSINSFRRGSIHDRISEGVADAAEMRNIVVDDKSDRAICHMEDIGLWRFDLQSTDVDDGSTVLQPNFGSGRWLLDWPYGGPGAPVSISVAVETFVDTDFTNGGSTSTLTLANSGDGAASAAGMYSLIANGVHAIDGVITKLVAAPPTAVGEYSVTGTALEIFGLLNGTENNYQLHYPY